MHGERRGGIVVLISFVILAVLAVPLTDHLATHAVSHAAHQNPSPVLPSSWNGYDRIELIQGQDALTEATRLYGKSLPIQAGYRARFAKSQSDGFTVWIGVTGSGSEARALCDQITALLDAGHTGFVKPLSILKSGIRVFQTTGMGLVHFYYVKGPAVYWVAMPETGVGSLAGRIIAEM